MGCFPDPDPDERFASDADARPWPLSASFGGQIWSEEVVEILEESREEVESEVGRKRGGGEEGSDHG